MPSVALHKDVMRYQEKIYGGITSKQVKFIGVGILVGAVVWGACSLLGIGFETAATVVMVVVIPIAMCAMWEPDGLDPIVYLRIFLENLTTRQRLLYLSKSDATGVATASQVRNKPTESGDLNV